MTGRWSWVVLVVGLAACRTPQKKVSVYSLDDDDSNVAHHLRAGSDVGDTVTGQINLPHYADTETATNLPIAQAPLAPAGLVTPEGTAEPRAAPGLANLQLNPGGCPNEGVQRSGLTTKLNGSGGFPVGTTGNHVGGTESVAAPRIVLPDGARPVLPTPQHQNRLEVGASGPVESARLGGSVHLPTGGWQARTAEGPTRAAVSINRSPDRSPSLDQPVSQSIHLSFPTPANSIPRQPDVPVDLQPGVGTGGGSHHESTRVPLPLGDRGCSASALGSERSIAVPAVGRPAPNVGEWPPQPVDLAPLLAVAHDADWRQRQAERQRAAETARQAERDSLDKSLQQFLQASPN